MSDTLVPMLTTDLLDYSPGSTATIAASGFVYSGLVTFEALVFASDGTLIDDVVWTVSDDALSDPTFSGTLTTNLAILPTYANTTIQLTATETTAGADGVWGTQDDVVQTAATTFTDNPPPQLPTLNEDVPATPASPTSLSGPGGAIFMGIDAPNGIGVIHPFVRIEADHSGSEQGYNTDFRNGSPILNDKLDLNFTHSILLNDVPLVDASDNPDPNGGYYAFRLHVNQDGNNTLLSLDNLQIYLASAHNLGDFDPGLDPASGTGHFPIGDNTYKAYDLDLNGDHYISIDTLSGGPTDIAVLIPKTDFTDDPNFLTHPYVYLYSAFGYQDGQTASDSGFEAWWLGPTAPPGPGGNPSAVAVVDKQLSGFVDPTAHPAVNGGQWYDVSQSTFSTDVTNPSDPLYAPVVLIHSNVYFQALISNFTDPSTNMSAWVEDSPNLVFYFGGNAADSLAHAVTVTPTTGLNPAAVFTATLTDAQAGLNSDTVTVHAFTDGQIGTTDVTDTANYFGAAPSINVEKLVSVDGGVNWWLLPDDNGNAEPAADLGYVTAATGLSFGVGGKLHIGTPTLLSSAQVAPQYEFVVTNTGNVDLSTIHLSDPTLSVSQDASVSAMTSKLVSGFSVTWKAGSVSNTATVTSSFTDSFGNVAEGSDNTSLNYWAALNDSDTVKYTGLAPSINVEKLVSVDGGLNWYLLLDDTGGIETDAEILAITSAYGFSGTLHTAASAAFLPSAFVGAGVEFEVVVTNTGNVTLTNVSVADADSALSGGSAQFTFGLIPSSTISSLAVNASVLSNFIIETAISGSPHSDVATASAATITDSALNTFQPTDSDTSGYNGKALSPSVAGLTAGFWSQHPQIWDVTTGDDSKWVGSLSPKIISLGSDLNQLYGTAAHTDGINWNQTGGVTTTPVNSSGLAANPTGLSWGGDSGLLLGDLNHNGQGDDNDLLSNSGHTYGTLYSDGAHSTDLFFDLYSAQQLLLASTSGDAHIIMANQALAAQLNEYNEYVYDTTNGNSLASGGHAEPFGLIEAAVEWLLGKGPLALAGPANSIDFATGNDQALVPTVLNDGIAKDYSTASPFKLSAAALPSSSLAWNDVVNKVPAVAVYTESVGWINTIDPAHPHLVTSPITVYADGEGLKNALAAYNNGLNLSQQAGFVVSSDGSTVAWKANGVISDVQANTVGSFWGILHDWDALHPLGDPLHIAGIG